MNGTRFKSIPDTSMHSRFQGTGLAITYRCIDCNEPRSPRGGRYIKGTRVFRCLGCWDERAAAKATTATQELGPAPVREAA